MSFNLKILIFSAPLLLQRDSFACAKGDAALQPLRARNSFTKIQQQFIPERNHSQNQMLYVAFN
ncbi:MULTISPECIES: hypothetical protein [Nostocales]|uniref:Uncharacterized protein n=3 Tax=Nostocales TaxID=1161 RepID=A0A0C1RBT0_9CYAN|nr:hypothetical protein [Tolypothrix bouteillei]KAF3884624.1 hypothetical protein DA73_0400003385 [Tolypothrix bouteillei VB521301]